MHNLRAIKADTDEEVALLEKASPLIVQQYAVSLKRVVYSRARPSTGVLKVDGPTEELNAGEGWLTTLPGKARHPNIGDVLHVLGQERLQHAAIDPPANPCPLQRLAIVAVAAVEVAVGGDRLEQD
jgi:hypothetical protein